MRKKYLFLSLILFFIFSSYLYFFHLSSADKNNPLMAVPKDASIILQIENPFQEWNKIADNPIWNYLKTNAYLAELGQEMDTLTDNMRGNEAIYELIINRPLVFSVHKTRSDDYDFFYSIDLQKATQFNFLKNYISELSEEIDKVYTRDFKGKEITEIRFKNTTTPYYLYLHKNLLCISSTHNIIENSIKQLSAPAIIRDIDFIDVSNELGSNDINIYFNHRALKKYLRIWFDDQEALAVFDRLSFSALSMQAEENFISLEGYSKLKKSKLKFIDALLESGEGPIRVGSIVPDDASYFMSLGFKEINSFYENMQKMLQEDEKTSSYIQSKEKIEKYLGISFKEDFLSWVDQEIALIQLNSTSKENEIDLALAIRHSDIELAREKLEYISKQIKKKTPIKFKGITYKGYPIKFLSVKGFFKLLLGNTFEGIEKPYYTILDEYVVFSNSPRTLGKIITAVQSESTLSQRDEYSAFLAEFDDESNLFAYISAEELVQDIKELTEQETWNALQPHLPYFKSFPMMGAQFEKAGNILRHEFRFNYFNHQQMRSWQLLVQESDAQALAEVDTITAGSDSEEEYIVVENILPEDLNSKNFVEYYDNGEVKFEVSLKNGLKDGRYYQYDSLGNLLIKGRYKEDRKVGRWKYYDKDGNLVEKKRF